MKNLVVDIIFLFKDEDFIRKFKDLEFDSDIMYNIQVIDEMNDEISGDIVFIKSNDLEKLDFELLGEKFNKIYSIAQKFNKNKFQRLYRLGVSDIIYYNFIDYEITKKISDYYNKQSKFIENQTLKRIIDKSKNSVVITDAEGNVEYVNKYFLETTGYNEDEILGKNTNVLKSGEHRNNYYRDLWKKIKSNEVWEGFFINKDKKGDFFYEEARITPIIFPDEDIVNYVKIAKNVTKEKMLEDQMKMNASVAIEVMESLFPEKYNGKKVSFDFLIKHFNELGGDILTFDRYDNKIYLSLIDVTGHDLSSTLIAINAMTTFKDSVYEKSLKKVVEMINNNLCAINYNSGISKYATGVFIEIDLDKEIINYINAGHPEIILVDKDNNFDSVPSNNLMLGVLNSYKYTVKEIDIKNTCEIITFSDGLLETLDMNYDFAIKELISKYQKHIESDKTSLKKLYGDLIKNNDYKDDASIGVIRFIN